MNTWAGLPGAAKLLDSVWGGAGSGATDDASTEGRFDYARDAAVTSYRNRFGRPPSEAELRDSMPHFMTREDQEAFRRERNNPAQSPYVAGFRGPPTSQQKGKPPVAPEGVANLAKSILALAMRNPGDFLQQMLQSPIAAATVAPAAILQQRRENWLNGLGVDRNLMAQNDAEVGEFEKLLGDIQDAYYGRHGDSFETYAKRQKRPLDCRYSTGPKIGGKLCVYGGHTHGDDEPEQNVLDRFSDGWPSRDYEIPVLDKTSSSYGAIIGQEQRLIDHYRRLNRSDNVRNAFSPDSVLARYYRWRALGEFGNFLPPIK